MESLSGNSLLQALETLEELNQQQPVGQDQRKYERISVRGEGELLALRPSRGCAGIPIQFRDASWGGIGFIAQQQLPSGSRWILNLVESDMHLASQVIAVCYSKEVSDNAWLVGAEVQADPAMLRLLGFSTRQMRDAAL